MPMRNGAEWPGMAEGAELLGWTVRERTKQSRFVAIPRARVLQCKDVQRKHVAHGSTSSEFKMSLVFGAKSPTYTIRL